MKKYRSKTKQSAYESYERAEEYNKTKSFEELWKNSMKSARKLYSFGKNKEYRQLSKNARIFFQDELYYRNTGITFNDVILNSSGKSDEIKNIYEETERTIYDLRTKQFFKLNGYNSYTYNKETKSLDEWFEDYQNKKITKEEMNDIIKTYKEQNPDRSAYYSNTEDNEDILENGFIP